MTLAGLKTLLESITAFDNKVAYRAFPEGQAPALPFICYLATETDNFMADNHVYTVIQNVDIELYSRYKDVTSEALIEAKLDENYIPWNKYDEYIESENVYETVYSISL